MTRVYIDWDDWYVPNISRASNGYDEAFDLPDEIVTRFEYAEQAYGEAVEAIAQAIAQARTSLKTAGSA